MKYKSTRGRVSGLTFEDCVLSGLADDGGLLIPDSMPKISPEEMKAWGTMKYSELAFAVMRKFIDPAEIPDRDLRSMVQDSYKVVEGQWRHDEIAPLRKMKNGILVMELFHGPTFAFKDVALQFLGNLFAYILEKRKQRMVILGATSGDTGSAAIYGVRGKKNIDCVIMYPDGRTSKTQERQMATVPDANITTLALSGTFDDCQDIVKASFNSPLKQQYSLGAVNSINFARILAQIVYYGYSSLRLLPKKAVFSVPTGNFGDILAGYYAKAMGFPVEGLLVASNMNDVLTRYFETGVYHNTGVQQTMSPSMDIAISSNFERFLYDVVGGDAATLRKKMEDLKGLKRFEVTKAELKHSQDVFTAYCVSEAECAETIKQVYEEEGYLLCPHSAIGYAAVVKHIKKHAQSGGPDVEYVTLATAHYGKFIEEIRKHLASDTKLMDALEKGMPEQFRAMEKLPLRKTRLAARESAVMSFMHRRFGKQPYVVAGPCCVGTGCFALAQKLLG